MNDHCSVGRRQAQSQRYSPMQNPVPLFSEKPNWLSEIGRFILNFGQVEWFLCAYLKDFVQTSPSAVVPRCLTDRVKAVADHFTKNKRAQTTEFTEWRKRLEPIRQLRNHIAHGYMFVTQIDGALAVCICQVNDLNAEADSKRLTFSELQNNNESLTELIEQFKTLTGWTTSEEIELKSHSKPVDPNGTTRK
jgi:hypothetical protein